MKLILPVAGFFIALSGCFFKLILGKVEDDINDLSAIKIIEKYGYPAESHLIETEDGYFLQLQRIPHGKNSWSTSPKGPLLFSHGILSSSDIFLLMGPDSLPFVAADRGYDVWLGNFRGNHYAKLHRTLTNKNSEFWNFSFHEVGLYDLPAQIDYICNYTQRNNVTLLGHSFGSTVQLVMATTRPDYQKKVRAAVLMAAPSVFIRQKGYFLLMAPLYPLAYSKAFTNSEVFGDSPTGRKLRIILGVLGEKYQRITKILQSLFHKLGTGESIKIEILNYVLFYPTSTSMKVFMHYFQQALSGKFQQYDYGPAENHIRYKSREPPEYNLESITIPTSLVFTENDMVAGIKDEEFLFKRMPNIKSVLNVTAKGYNHMAFLIGKKNKEVIYDKVLDLMENL